MLMTPQFILLSPDIFTDFVLIYTAAQLSSPLGHSRHNLSELFYIYTMYVYILITYTILPYVSIFLHYAYFFSEPVYVYWTYFFNNQNLSLPSVQLYL